MVILFIIPALVSLLLSVGLFFSGIPDSEFYSLYVGLWVPSILSLGILVTISEKQWDKK
jgi:hypothetical protein